VRRPVPASLLVVKKGSLTRFWTSALRPIPESATLMIPRPPPAMTFKRMSPPVASASTALAVTALSWEAVILSESLKRGCQTELDCEHRRTGAVCHAELGQHIGNAITGRLWAQSQSQANLLVRLADRELSQHVELARSQRGHPCLDIRAPFGTYLVLSGPEDSCEEVLHTLLRDREALEERFTLLLRAYAAR